MLRGNSLTSGTSMYQQFKKFLADKIADFRRIVRQARGQVELEDLQSSAWIVATEMGEKRKSEIDLSNKQDQEEILATLYSQSVRGGKSIRYAASLDQAIDCGEDTLPSLAETLPGPENSDPLKALLHIEQCRHTEAANDLVLATTFSQAAAYAISLDKFADLDSLSIYLAISSMTLTQRISRATFSLRVQDSMFDGIERIPQSFMPKQGNERISARTRPAEQEQLALIMLEST